MEAQVALVLMGRALHGSTSFCGARRRPIRVQNIPTSMATLGNVVRDIHGDHTDKAGHGPAKYQKTSRLSPLSSPSVPLRVLPWEPVDV